MEVDPTYIEMLESQAIINAERIKELEAEVNKSKNFIDELRVCRTIGRSTYEEYLRRLSKINLPEEKQ